MIQFASVILFHQQHESHAGRSGKENVELLMNGLIIPCLGRCASTGISFCSRNAGVTGTYNEKDHLFCGGRDWRRFPFRLLLTWRTCGGRWSDWRPWRCWDRRSRVPRIDHWHARGGGYRSRVRCGNRCSYSPFLPAASSSAPCLCTMGLGRLRPSGLYRLLLSAKQPIASSRHATKAAVCQLRPPHPSLSCILPGQIEIGLCATFREHSIPHPSAGVADHIAECGCHYDERRGRG